MPNFQVNLRIRSFTYEGAIQPSDGAEHRGSKFAYFGKLRAGRYFVILAVFIEKGSTRTTSTKIHRGKFCSRSGRPPFSDEYATLLCRLVNVAKNEYINFGSEKEGGGGLSPLSFTKTKYPGKALDGDKRRTSRRIIDDELAADLSSTDKAYMALPTYCVRLVQHQRFSIG